tara:strand:- start:290 stop:460 length:171 start_codon:yes stop_codon:yes gene_type:complete
MKKLINKSTNDLNDDLISKNMINFSKVLYLLKRSIMGAEIRYFLNKFVELNQEFKE